MQNLSLGSKAPSPLRSPGAFQILVLALVCGLFQTECHRPEAKESESAVSIDYQVSPQPPRVGPATITLKLSDRAGEPISGASVQLEGNMTHAGMVPEFSAAAETAPGSYRGRLDFSMSGDWIILVHLTLPGGQKLDKQLEVKAVQPG